MTPRQLILDTGPLVAFLSARDRYHHWSRGVLDARWRVLTCEAVVSEAAFLLQRDRAGTDSLLALVEEGGLELVGVAGEAASLRSMMRRYREVPMSFADACLVRLSELHPSALLATLDSDFTRYRRFSRQLIPLRMPPR